MGRIIKPLGRSNWQQVVLALIEKNLVGRNPYFSRADLLSTFNFNTAYKLLEILGHKKKPKHPEESFQNALNTIRKKGYVNTIEPGEYKMTEAGYRKLKEPGQTRFKEAFQILIVSEKTECVNA